MAHAPALFDGIGFSEMLVIAFLAILVFGGNLPDALRNLGRQYAKFRKSLGDVSRPLRDEIQRATTLPPDLYPPPLSAPTLPAPPPEPPAPYGAVPPTPGPAGPAAPMAAPAAGPSAAPVETPAAPFDDEPPP